MGVPNTPSKRTMGILSTAIEVTIGFLGIVVAGKGSLENITDA
jgi:hypothetical protein